MLGWVTDLFSHFFLARAVFAGILVALCASLLGVSLVLKRYSMIGDGLSHVGFGALCVALALQLQPLAVSLPVVILVAFLLLRLSENSKIKGDAAIALISTSSLAFGVIVISSSAGMNTDVYSYLFGSILAMSQSDVIFSAGLSFLVLLLFILFYNRLFAVTFDESFARATGTNAGAYNMLLSLLTAMTIVVGMRLMGAMLISSLIVFPALTAMRVCKRFQTVIVCAAAVSALSFFIGICLSYGLNWSTGASVVLVNLAAFLLASLLGFLRQKGGLRQ